MNCKTLRYLLLTRALPEGDEEAARHLETCPKCAKIAARWERAREALARRVEAAPPPAFARRVVAHLPGPAEILGRLALRALPAAVVLALALAWVGLDQAPLPATSLLAGDPGPEALLTYSVLAPEVARK
jgi:anti-sigma factor RsiW